MKLTSAFFACLVVLTLFVGLAGMSFALELGEVTGFFVCSAVVFGMILPSCSTKD